MRREIFSEKQKLRLDSQNRARRIDLPVGQNQPACPPHKLRLITWALFTKMVDA
jgi:hypothetical protein